MAVDRVSQSVIEELADSEARLLERVFTLEAEVRAYRELALSALSQLTDISARHLRQTHRLRALLEERGQIRSAAA